MFHFQTITFSLGPYKCSTSIHQLIHYQPSLPNTNLLPDLLATSLTMQRTPFASVILSSILFKPPFGPPFTVTPRYLNYSVSSIFVLQILHLLIPLIPFIQTTVDFFSFPFKPYSSLNELTSSQTSAETSHSQKISKHHPHTLDQPDYFTLTYHHYCSQKCINFLFSFQATVCTH